MILHYHLIMLTFSKGGMNPIWGALGSVGNGGGMGMHPINGLRGPIFLGFWGWFNFVVLTGFSLLTVFS